MIGVFLTRNTRNVTVYYNYDSYNVLMNLSILK